MTTAQVVSINVSPGGIPKTPAERIVITPAGLTGDAHNHDKHNTPLQAVSICDVETLRELTEEGYDLAPGAIGENLTTRYLPQDSLAVGDRLTLSSSGSDDVLLEITKQRKPCFVLDSIDPKLKVDLVGRCGWLARVVQPGSVRVGAIITHHPASTTPRDAAAVEHTP